jgi:DNA polymerase elongation subunit (family B)
MTKYNMQDCEVTLNLCFKLDLINQMIAICNITRSYIVDVMVSSTGAIAASALCNYALNEGREYIWTRCDYHPVEFLGGYVQFKRPIVCRYPMIVDFVSMYPSIMSYCKISPETIDYVDRECYGLPRFTKRVLLLCYVEDRGTISIGMTLYGFKEVASSGCDMWVLIGKHCKTVSFDAVLKASDVRRFCEKQALLMMEMWNILDKANQCVDVVYANLITNRHFYGTNTRISQGQYDRIMLNQCKEMMRWTGNNGKEYSNLWVPEVFTFASYGVDWEVSPLGTETIVSMPDSICKHTLGSNIASSVCTNLMSRRKLVKSQMKRYDGVVSPDEDTRNKAKVCNLLQWALKIAANSLFMVL